MPIEFRILGPLEVSTDGRILAPGQPKAARPARLLLVHANEMVSRDGLIEELWGEAAPATVDSALHVYLSAPRRLLRSVGADAVLVRQAHGYRLRDRPRAGRCEPVRTPGRGGQRGVGNREGGYRRGAVGQSMELGRGPALADLQSERLRDHGRRADGRETHLRGRTAVRRQPRPRSPPRSSRQLETLIAEHPYREAPARTADARP